jgi:hypothetical protein
LVLLRRMEIECGSERFTAASTICPKNLRRWGPEGHKREKNKAVVQALEKKCR